VSEVIYCANRCTRPTDSGDRIRVQTEPPSQLCNRCEDNLRQWLRDIPDRYALLPLFVEHGTTEPDPDKRSAKRTDAPAPMRLEVVDLLDERYGRRWLGTEAADDRRGVLGTLESWARMVREERNLPRPEGHATVTGEAALLSRHLLWIVEQPWVDEFYDDIKAVNRNLRDAVGDHRVRPVGRCPVTSDEGTCGGALMPTKVGGVRCVSGCGTQWGYDDLRRLGLVIGEDA